MAPPVPIVVIDDHAGSLELLSTALRREDLKIHRASNPADGLELVRRIRPRLVLTDLMMPGMSGIDLLDKVINFDPTIDVVLMTAHYTTETAVEAIRKGAADYLEKPLDIALLRRRVESLLASSRRRTRFASDGENPHEMMFEGIVARSERMWELFGAIERIAPHYRSVLVQGQTGSGKELVAKALHKKSGVPGRFVVVNCSAVMETLFESEMFGHMRGAFTGADRDKVGLFEAANRGTVFLDEVGDMPLGTQAKVLRAIQNQEVLPVGSVAARPVNVRVIAATNRDLRAAIAKGQFREDLFFRLSMVELVVPPLVQRTKDIPLLAKSFVKSFSEQYGKAVSGLTPRALVVLENYAWPGNVRELEHVIGRACMLAEGEQIDAADLPEHLLRPGTTAFTNGEAVSSFAGQERRIVEDALSRAQGNQSRAARSLGIGRDALRYKMRKFGLLAEDAAEEKNRS